MVENSQRKLKTGSGLGKSVSMLTLGGDRGREGRAKLTVRSNLAWPEYKAGLRVQTGAHNGEK